MGVYSIGPIMPFPLIPIEKAWFYGRFVFEMVMVMAKDKSKYNTIKIQ